MDFEEFLWALGQDDLVNEIEKCYNANIKMFEPVHDRLIDYYKNYLFVGGMPDNSKWIMHQNRLIAFSST